MKRIIGLLVLGIFLSSCSSKSPIEMVAESGISVDNEAITTSACFEYLKVRDAKEMALYENMESADKERALSTRSMMKMVADLTGKSDLCKPGTNVWDATIAWSKENEITKRQYSSDVRSVATFGVGAYGAFKITDAVLGKVGDRINTSGDSSGVTKTTTTTSNTNTAIAADKSTATNGTTAKEESVATGACTISSTALSDCRTTAAGAATPDEYNACLTRDYGHTADQIAACPQ